MVRHSSSSIRHPPPLSYNVVPKDMVLRVISNHLEHLLDKMHTTLDKLVKLKGGMGTYELEIDEQNVIIQTNFVMKVKNKISSSESRPLRVVAEHLQDLHQKRAVILEAEECLCLGESLLKRQQNALLSKREVMHQIDMLEKIIKEVSLVQLPLTGGHRCREVDEYQLPPLMMCQLRGFTEISDYSLDQFSLTGGHRGREVDEYKLPPLMMCLRDRGLAEIFGYRNFASTGVSPTGECPGESIRKRPVEFAVKYIQKSVWRCKAVRNLKFRPSIKEKETREVPFTNWVESESLNKQRYLCFTNGFEIYFLDLKQGNDQTFNIADDVPPLPKIATLNMWEGLLPIASVGLFKWESKAYMICGKVAPVMEVNPSSFDYDRVKEWGYKLQKLYEGGSACDIHRLIPTDGGLSISHSESNIGKLNKPKFWPIAENIGGQIHLIDTLPRSLVDVCNVWTFSHEVLNTDGTWTEISSPIESVLHIRCHLVVGNCIFAISPMDLYFENHSKRSYLVFDIGTKEWVPSQRHEDRYIIKEVWDILELGHARCAGGFPYGQPSNPLYVIIALQPDRFDDERNGTRAVAYLVTPTGQVVCIQVLRNFFTGPVWPCQMLQHNLIEAEGKTTMCSIVIASAWDHWNDITLQYVFVNTFSVKELTHAASQVRQLWEKGSKAWPVEQDFVSVDIKDKCVYKRYWEVEETASSVQACFL